MMIQPVKQAVRGRCNLFLKTKPILRLNKKYWQHFLRCFCLLVLFNLIANLAFSNATSPYSPSIPIQPKSDFQYFLDFVANLLPKIIWLYAGIVIIHLALPKKQKEELKDIIKHLDKYLPFLAMFKFFSSIIKSFKNDDKHEEKNNESSKKSDINAKNDDENKDEDNKGEAYKDAELNRTE